MLKDEWRKALEMGYLSLRELCEWNLEGCSFTGDSENMLSKTLEMEVCFHRGLAFAEHGGTLLS